MKRTVFRRDRRHRRANEVVLAGVVVFFVLTVALAIDTLVRRCF